MKFYMQDMLLLDVQSVLHLLKHFLVTNPSVAKCIAIIMLNADHLDFRITASKPVKGFILMVSSIS